MMSTIHFHSYTEQWTPTRIPVLVTNKRLFASWNSLYELFKPNFSFHTFGVHTLQYHVVRVKCYATLWLWFYFRRMVFSGRHSFIHTAYWIGWRRKKNKILQIFSSVSQILEIPFLFGLRLTLRCSQSGNEIFCFTLFRLFAVRECCTYQIRRHMFDTVYVMGKICSVSSTW